LQHIHELNLVHRDLKPANLMLVPAPVPGQPDNTLRATVKILDIGLGRALFDENSLNADLEGLENMQLTAEGVLLGTPDYLSPEQARDARNIDIRSDIYSLGCVLYYTLAGQPPFPDTNIISQMVRHATEPPRPLKTLNAAAPDGLQQIVNRMLAKEPAQRYPTPERAAQALQEFLAAGSEPARALEAEPQMKKYLTWLETGNANGEDAGQVAAALPLALPVPTPVSGKGPGASRPTARPASPKDSKNPTPPAAIPVTPARRHHGKKHKGKKHAGPAPSAKVSSALPVEEYDVELVPTVVAPTEEPEPGRGRGLSRRDWFLLGIGAGAALVAAGVGVLLHVLHDNSSEEDD
jgi:serine/threonine protein kinase